ncbi:MAG: hypothetical protein JWQ28_870 [Pedobacter sp.]|jgi:hypothetical protein|nr:hypothetical protein [Pedobacter sp.]
MELKEPVLKLLNKLYEPDCMIEIKFKRYDLAVKTDEAGRPILLYMGQRDEQGSIKGERYTRRLKFDNSGNMIKDHWEHKGKAT